MIIGDVKSNLIRFIGNAFKKGINKPIVILLEGSPGIGKTQILRQIAQQLKLEFLETDLLSRGVQDFQIIWPDPNKNIARTLIPEGAVFPKFKKGLWLIDEFTSAQPDIQTMFKRYTFERILPDGSPLPLEVIVLLTGNKFSDSATRYATPAPVINSLRYYTVEPYYKDWLQNYARPNGLDPTIIGFIQAYPDYFYNFNSDTWDGRQFCSPRSLEMLSEDLRILDGNVPADVIAAAIGLEAATKFSTYKEFVGKIPMISLIFEKKLSFDIIVKDLNYSNTETPETIGAMVYFLEVALNYLLANAIPENLEYFFGLLAESAMPALAVSGFITSLNRLRSVHPEYMHAHPVVKSAISKLSRKYPGICEVLRA